MSEDPDLLKTAEEWSHSLVHNTVDSMDNQVSLSFLLDQLVKRIGSLEADLNRMEEETVGELNEKNIGLARDKAELEGRLGRYEKNLPSWRHGTPEDVDAWIRDLIPDDKRLAFYRWIGTSAVREAVADAKDQLGNDPVPIEHRYYTPDNVDEILDLMAPDEGDIGYPSVLPIGRPFCDVPHHTHTHGGGRLPTCRLDSEE